MLAKLISLEFSFLNQYFLVVVHIQVSLKPFLHQIKFTWYVRLDLCARNIKCTCLECEVMYFQLILVNVPVKILNIVFS